ncbi:MAG: serine hydrolase domain-containing protein [Burkholderiaceae bacterium]
MAFTCFNRNIPDEAHTKIQEMGPAGVRVFAFAPGGGWVIVTETGHFARGIPDECFEQIGSLRAAGHRIRVVAFPPAGGFVIVTDKTYFARGIPDECYDRLGKMWNAGARPTCIAFPRSGGNRWAILAGKALYCRGIDDECYQLLCNFAQGLRPAQRVAFTPSGGFVILAQDRYFARRIPDECYLQMGKIGANYRVDHVNFEFGDGWSIVTNTPKTAAIADPLRNFEARMVQKNGAWQSIVERMAAYQVPGVSVAVVRNNQVAWATTYGRVEKDRADHVHADTVFQAASCSKPVSGIAFLQLVQDGLIGLDEDVNPKLGWTLPRRSCASSSWASHVTLRNLLRHRGGIIGRDATNPTTSCSAFNAGGGGGFGGYANVSGVGVPTVKEVLNGASSRSGVIVNSHKVELVYEPDTMGAYSGEGFVLMMQLLQNRRGVAFADWMQSHVLAPTKMSDSTFALSAPSHSGPPAAGHRNNEVIAGKRNRYPEGAAAGLYTTATDLCRFIIMVNQGGVVGSQTVLDATRHQQMMSAGLGMPTGHIGSNAEWFWHNGGNAGFSCQFKGYPKQKAGFAVLTNGESGELHDEIAQALIRTYGWE